MIKISWMIIFRISRVTNIPLKLIYLDSCKLACLFLIKFLQRLSVDYLEIHNCDYESKSLDEIDIIRTLSPTKLSMKELGLPDY